MNFRKFDSILLLMLLIIILSGCSKGSSNPAMPGLEPDLRDSETDPVQTHLWGYFTVSIDTETLEVTVTPNRQMMFTANVVTFLNSNPTTLGFHINDVPTGADYIDVDIDVTLKHPFPGLPEYHGYDVRGIFMGDGSSELVTGGVVHGTIGTDQVMLPDPDGGNGAPDGYTRWYNFTEFSEGGPPMFQYTAGKVATPGFNGTATLNPYRYFADGLGVNDDLWTWIDSHADQNGQFSSGASNTRNYYIRFPNTKGVVFGYAVIADWKGPEEINHPANASEAVALNVSDNDSTVYYAGPTENGGDLKMDISVWNWNAQLSAGAMEDYRIIVESSVLTNPYEAKPSDMIPSGGTENYSTYHIEIPADDVQSVDGNDYWVIIEQTGYDYTNEFGVPNLADTDKLAAYFHYDLSVLDESPVCPIPVPSAITGSPAKNEGLHTETITSTNLMGTTGLAVYLDMDGVIDGSYDIEGTNIQNVNVPAGTLDATFDLTGAVPGDYYVVLTNACGETGVSEVPLFTIEEYLVGDIYVSNHSDFDGLPEYGTMENPYHSINAGIAASTVDDLILVDFGTGIYPEEIYLYGGARYIVIRAYNWYSQSGRPVLGGPDTPGVYPTIQLVHCDYVTFRGFEIMWSAYDDAGWTNMVELLWTENIVLEDCLFTGDPLYDTARLIEVVSPYWTLYCEIKNCLFKDINVGQDTVETNVQFSCIGGGWNIDLLIARNEFTDLQNEPVIGKTLYLTSIDIVFDWGGINILNNLIHHQAPESDTGIYFYGIYNLWPLADPNPNNGLGWIANNTIDNISLAGCPDGYASGGTAVENTPNSSLPITDIDIHSNLVTEFTGSATQWIYGIADPNVTDYTDLYHVLRGTVEYPWADPAHEGVGCIYNDPQYVNSITAPYDYQLESGSPAEGTGKNGEDMGCYGNLSAGQKVGLLSPE